MSQINPFAGVIASSATVQRQQAAEKSRQLRHQAELQKNSALGGEDMQDQVESADAVLNLSDHPDQPAQQKQPQKKKPRPKFPGQQLNLTA